MPKKSNAVTYSPIGASVRGDTERAIQSDPELRQEMERLEPFEKLARLVLRRRHELGLTQEQVAERMGTTASAVCRIETGQYQTRPETLQKLARALGGQAVVGIMFGDDIDRAHLIEL